MDLLSAPGAEKSSDNSRSCNFSGLSELEHLQNYDKLSSSSPSEASLAFKSQAGFSDKVPLHFEFTQNSDFADHHSRQNSICKLPTEILVEIFCQVYTVSSSHWSRCYRDGNGSISDGLVHTDSPVGNFVSKYLSQVSQYWRQVAMTLPQLWRNLTISFPACTTPPDIEQIDAWLCRVKPTFPVTLYLDVDAGVYAAPTPGYRFFDNYSRALATVISRNASVIGGLIFSNYSDSPTIRSCNVLFENLFPYKCIFTRTTVAASCQWPLLRTLFVAETNIELETRLSAGRHALPWCRLTTVQIDYGILATDASAMIVLCTNLVECSLNIEADDPPTHPPNRHTLTTLKTLRLTTNSDRRWSHFFDAIALPALKTLHLAFLGLVDIDSHILDFKTRSSLDLERIVLEFFDLDHLETFEFIRFLSDMPSLTSIVAKDSNLLREEFLRALIFQPQQRLAPNLRHLDVSWGHPTSMNADLNVSRSYDLFMDMVESRLPPVDTLASHSDCHSDSNPLSSSSLKAVLFSINTQNNEDSKILKKIFETPAHLERVEKWSERGLKNISIR